MSGKLGIKRGKPLDVPRLERRICFGRDRQGKVGGRGTRRFTLGAPRGIAISPDGARVTFLRSRGGTDPVTCLWSLDVATGEERLVADPLVLGDDGDDLPTE